MSRRFISSLLTGLTLAVTIIPSHAKEPAQQCNARRADYLVGEILTRTIKETARTEARAANVTVNSLNQEFEVNRLRITTDMDYMITDLSCG